MRPQLVLASLVMLLPCIGCSQGVNTVGYASFGAPIEPAHTMTVSDAVAKADSLEGKPVCVKAEIAEVCAHRGCWMMLTDGTQEMRVRFTKSQQCADGFLVPRNAAGHNAFVHGTLEAREVPEAEARHYAEDAGKPKEEIEKIVGPQKSVMMVATGVMISDGDKLDAPVQ